MLESFLLSNDSQLQCALSFHDTQDLQLCVMLPYPKTEEGSLLMR